MTYLLGQTLRRLLLPSGLAGVAGLVAILASLYFSVARRDGDNALFLICLGWHLSLLGVVMKTATMFRRVYQSPWIGPFPPLPLRSWYSAVCVLVLPVLLTAPAAWALMGVAKPEALLKHRWRVAATIVAVLSVLLLLMFSEFGVELKSHPLGWEGETYR